MNDNLELDAYARRIEAEKNERRTRVACAVACIADADDHFRALGATHSHDSMYPDRRDWMPSWPRIFSIHYFKDGAEIGYCIPDLLDGSGFGVIHFEKPRMWSKQPTLRELPPEVKP